ncbi:MAG: class I SAM-dependent methyltransferase [Chloroflexia bacterium]
MASRLSPDEIRAYWTQQALAHGQSPAASWTDQPVIELEIQTITQYLAEGDRVLDVGCANGFSTVQFAAFQQIAILGLDYIPAMIDAARERLAGLADRLRGTVDFAVGDARQLALPDAQFDKVVVVRVIINLGEWPDQVQGLQECVRMVKPGGLLLLSEATLQGWRRLNALRREWGLPDIPVPGFNNYLDEEMVVAALAPWMELQAIINFASTYYVGSRVLKPMLARACNLEIDVADPLMEWNRWFAQLPSAGDYGTQKLLVFRKR